LGMVKVTQNATTDTPAALGFAMPAEWERHEATWLAWPHNPTDWPGKLEAVRWVYGEIVRRLALGERVRLLVNHKTDERLARRILACAGADLAASSSSVIQPIAAGRATPVRSSCGAEEGARPP
jgi:agmatine deiminase